MKYIVATTISETIRLASGATGETFTISGATKPDGSAWTGPTVTEASGGAYTVSFTPIQTGVYLATIAGTTSGEVFSGMWEIVDAPATKFTRRATGQVIAANDINELQQGLEKVEKVLGLS